MTNQAKIVKQTSQPSIYSHYHQAKKNLADLVPIDYFFAKEVFTALFEHAKQANVILKTEQNTLLFHLLISLNQSLREGHTCLPLTSIANQRIGFNSDDQGVVTNHGYVFPDVNTINSLISLIHISPNDTNVVVYDEGAVYLRRYFEFERQLTNGLQQRLQQSHTSLCNSHKPDVDNAVNLQQIRECLAALFPVNPVDDSKEIDWQKIAVANALNKNLSIIAGGPGTGKTYTVIKLLAALLMLHNKARSQTDNLRMALVAPTGKAAQRLSESIINAIHGFRGQIDNKVLDEIPHDTLTLHRLLGVIPNSTNFRFNQDNLLSIDVLLIDEVSMVDLALMTRLFRALPEHCKVIMLGDADQLPSVSAGSVLADIAPKPHLGYSPENLQYLIDVTQNDFTCLPEYKSTFKPMRRNRSDKINANSDYSDHLVFLTKSRRFDGTGGIGLIAKAVIEGDAHTSWQLLSAEDRQQNKQLSLLSKNSDDWLPDIVSRYYEPIFKCQQVNEAFSLLSKFRILCATRQGDYGVESFNDRVKSILLTKGTINNTSLNYHGQPIMISENDYRLGLYNGDVGLLWRNESGHLMAVFEVNNNELKWVIPSRLPQFTTVYAMTIHKTQGSEFDHLVMVLPQHNESKLLSRELLYTGITRAKTHISISSAKHVWQQGVETKVKRNSGLKIGG